MSYIVKGNPYGLFEKQSLTPNGSQDTFDLNYRPGQSGAILVVYGGVVQEPGSAYILVDGGRKIQMSFVPLSSETLYVLYLGRELSIPAVLGNHPIRESFVGNGVQTEYTLSVIPAEPALMVYVDGILQSFLSTWSLSGNKITFISAPSNNSKIEFYIHGVERTDLVSVPDSSITSSKLNLSYIPFSPAIFTFNGMGKASSNFITSKYLPLKRLVSVRLKFHITFSDTPDNKIRINLPSGYPNDGSELYAGSVFLTKGGVTEIGMIKSAGISQVEIARAANQNFTIGEQWTFEIVFDYDIS